MRIRITKRPTTPFVEACDVSSLQVGQTYDLNATVANYLVLSGYAIVEMRAADGNDDSRTTSSPPTQQRQ